MGKSHGLTAAQRRTLDRLSKIPELGGIYLAGGTAIAAHLGHRQSLDLDLFGPLSVREFAAARRGIARDLRGVVIVDETDVAVSMLIDRAPVDLVRYAYPLLRKPTVGPGGIALASLLDLATMKLSAVARRGIKRDFWDLHEICTVGGISLRRAARAYAKRFAVAEADLYAVLRSLTYFDDAKAEAIWPKGLTKSHWQTICAYFEIEAPKLINIALK